MNDLLIHFKKILGLSVTVGFISMASFILLYFWINNINSDLGRVMKVDLVAVTLLVIGFLLYKLKG